MGLGSPSASQPWAGDRWASLVCGVPSCPMWWRRQGHACGGWTLALAFFSAAACLALISASTFSLSSCSVANRIEVRGWCRFAKTSNASRGASASRQGPNRMRVGSRAAKVCVFNCWVWRAVGRHVVIVLAPGDAREVQARRSEIQARCRRGAGGVQRTTDAGEVQVRCRRGAGARRGEVREVPT